MKKNFKVANVYNPFRALSFKIFEDKITARGLKLSEVIIKECEEYKEERIREIIKEILDETNISFCNKSIFIKPNMLGFFPPERGVTTHPLFVKILIEEVKKRGASEIKVGDNPGVGGYSMNEKVARVTRIGEAAGNYFVNAGKAGMRVKIDGMNLLVSRDILNSDYVINVPKFKTHSLTVITGAIKNMFGIVIGADKANTHRAFPHPEDFSYFLAEIFALKPPVLTIVDGIVGMEGNGPSSGKLRRVGKIIASKDAVALDSIISRMMNFDPQKIPMIRRAKEMKLGDSENIKLKGKFEPLKKFSLPLTTRIGGGFIEKFVNSFGFYFVTRRFPALIKEKCNSCKICVEGCPQSAISMNEKIPCIDYSKCIACFCCHELCPKSAWRLKLKFFS